MMKLLKSVKTALLFLFFSSIILGILYPFFVYLVGATFFHHKAAGSLLYDNNKNIVGSKLIGQKFSSEKYFHSRPSRSEKPYDPLEPSNTNYGSTSKDLKGLVENDIKAYKAENSLQDRSLPVDAITASSSGLDPDISLANALLQAPRVAKARGLSTEDVIKLINKNKKKKTFKVFGNERVNVLNLNLSLDRYYKTSH